MAQIPEDNAPAVIVVKPERPSPVSRPPGTRVDPNLPKYDPSIIFNLELASVLTLRDQETLEALGEALATTLQALVRDAKNLHPLTVSRIVSYLLSLLRLSHVCVLKENMAPHLLIIYDIESAVYAGTCRTSCHFWI